MEIKILGLDPGIAIVGFGTIVCDPQPSLSDQKIDYRINPVRLEDFGIIKTKAKTPVSDRLNIIYND